MACRRSRVRLPLSPRRGEGERSVAEVAQLVEHQLPKLRVAGSSPVFRSKGEAGNLAGRLPASCISSDFPIWGGWIGEAVKGAKGYGTATLAPYAAKNIFFTTFAEKIYD